MMQYVIDLIARCGNCFDLFSTRMRKILKISCQKELGKKVMFFFDKMRKIFHFFNKIHKGF